MRFVILLAFLVALCCLIDPVESGKIKSRIKSIFSGRKNKPKTSKTNYGGGGYNSGKSKYGKSSGMGLLSNPKTKAVLGGIAGAYIGHQIGKGIGRMMFGGRPYYMGDRYYGGRSHSYMETCRTTIPSEYNEPWLTMDGPRIKTLIFECDRRTQHCCGFDCCQGGTRSRTGMGWWGVLLVLFFLGLIGCCAFYVFYRYCKQGKSFGSMFGGGHTNVPNNPPDAYYGQPKPADYGGQPAYPQPAAYGGQPPPYGGQPAPYGGQSAPYSGQPAPYGGQPAPYGGGEGQFYGGQQPYPQPPPYQQYPQQGAYPPYGGGMPQPQYGEPYPPKA